MRLPLLLLCLLPAISFAQEKLYIQSKASFFNENGVREKIKDECGLEEDVGLKVYSEMARAFPNAIGISDQSPPADGASVTLAILTVAGNSGSGWTGPKSMSVKADYRVGTQIVASEIITASSRGGFWGGFKGICSILHRDSTAIAKQLTKWLKVTRSTPHESLAANAQSSPGAPQANTIYLISPIEFSEGSGTRQSIKDECALPQMAEKYMNNRARSYKHTVQPISSYDNRGTVIRLKLNDAVASAGGVFTGEKSITAHVDLLRDGAVVASQDFMPTGTGGLNFENGSCRVLQNLVKSVSVLTVNWTIEQLQGGGKTTTAVAETATSESTGTP